MGENKFPIKGDLGKSFEKFKSSPLIGGCLIYREGDLFRWGRIVGTREDIERAINEAAENIKNSIRS